MSHAESVGTILSRILEKKNFKSMVDRQHLLDQWDVIVGERIAGKSEAKKIRDGSLIVEVENSMWMQELSFMKEDLLHRIREFSAGNEIEEIRFVPKR